MQNLFYLWRLKSKKWLCCWNIIVENSNKTAYKGSIKNEKSVKEDLGALVDLANLKKREGAFTVELLSNRLHINNFVYDFYQTIFEDYPSNN